HYGIIARSNRGIFAINELPDLQPRIQVGLLNILEEKDFQIRGFPVRIPLDVAMVFSANPEDYTNRGNIITPLRDRISSQILTHYPLTRAQGVQITAQESWIERKSGVEVRVPSFMRELIEEVAIQARKSEYVDQNSGVSARLTIALLENVVSNAERRGLATGEKRVVTRVCDLQSAVSAVSGKVELVLEGEQEGTLNVARALLGRGVKAVFAQRFPDAFGAGRGLILFPTPAPCAPSPARALPRGDHVSSQGRSPVRARGARARAPCRPGKDDLLQPQARAARGAGDRARHTRHRRAQHARLDDRGRRTPRGGAPERSREPAALQ